MIRSHNPQAWVWLAGSGSGSALRYSKLLDPDMKTLATTGSLFRYRMHICGSQGIFRSKLGQNLSIIHIIQYSLTWDLLCFVCKQLVPSFLLCPSAVPGRANLGKSSPESGSVYSILTFRRTGGGGE
jgi:hypothetical protein